MLRRKPLHRWSRKQLLDQIVACFTSRPETPDTEVRASVVFHHPLDKLPKDSEKRAREEVDSLGETWEGFRPYATFSFELPLEAKTEYLMGGLSAGDLTYYRPAGTVEEATVYAREWVGRSVIEVAFENVPGLFQVGFFEYIWGKELDVGPGELMWALPGNDEETVMVRQFPGALVE